MPKNWCLFCKIAGDETIIKAKYCQIMSVCDCLNFADIIQQLLQKIKTKAKLHILVKVYFIFYFILMTNTEF